jgi:ABC-2 type transport system permease protein
MATNKTDTSKTDKGASASRGRDANTGGAGSGTGAGKGMQRAAESFGFLAIVAAVLVLLNAVGYMGIFSRLDLTPNKIFSLSQGSKRLVSSLEDDLQVTVYYTAGLPPPWNAHERYVRDMLREYVAAGNGRVKLRWVDPDEESEKTAAREAGVQEQVLGAQDTTSLSVRQGFAGIVLEYPGPRESQQTLNFPGPTTEGLEYELSSRIQRLTRDALPVGVVTGHGSPTLAEGLTSLRSALSNYELREVNAGEEIDRELRALLIVDPKEPFTAAELQRINQFVMRGGSLGVFGGAVNLEMQGMAGPSATLVDTQLDDLLGPWGVELGQGIVADAQAVRIPMRTPFGLPAFVPFPPIPRIVFDEAAQEHPVTFRIPYAPFFFSAPIRTTARFRELNGVVLGRSSEDASWLLRGSTIPLQPRDPREWASTMTDERGPHAVLVALEGRLPSAFAGAGAMSNTEGDAPAVEAPAQAQAPVRVLVSGSGVMIRDELLPRGQDGAQQLTEGLILALNGVDWLAQDADLIAVRAKSIEEPPIDVPETIEAAEREVQAEQQAAVEQGAEEEGAEASTEARERLQAANEAWDRKKVYYQVGLSLGLPLLVALAGVLRWWRRSTKRANLQALRAKLSAAKKAR